MRGMDIDKRIVRDVVEDEGGPVIGYMIFCPACGNGHLFYVGRWTFNGDHERPTFSPSMLIRGTRMITDEERDRIMASERVEPEPLVCHSFVRDGRIEYLGDCTHEYAGKTVDLEPF
jgi:hypothetical protein